MKDETTRVMQKVLSLIGFFSFIPFLFHYILKCFTALEWCVESLTIPVYLVQIAFQLTELFQIEIDAVIYLTNLLVTIRNDQAKDGQESTFYMTTPPLISVRLLSLFWLLKR